MTGTGEGRPSLAAQLRKLAGHAAVYGSADVFTNLVNFLLVPIYTAYLSPTDYGVLALVLLFSTLAKIVFRMGLDAGFFRVHYDMDDERSRRRLAGTVVLFAGAAGTLLFAGAWIAAPVLARLLLGADTAGFRLLVRLASTDIYLGTFAFVPMQLLQIQERPGLFSTLSGGRQALNTVLKVILVMKGLGVAGILWSDVTATALYAVSLLPVTLRNVSLSLSLGDLREVLAFALPKVPHLFMTQIQDLADRKILDLYVSRAQVGIYQIGYTFARGIKFALSAFEPAWQPFVYSRIRQPDAPQVLARVVTYAWAAFVTVGLLVAVFGRELLQIMTPSNHAFWAAAPVIPVVTLGYLLQGVFRLTSVGIGIQKKARYYPVVTAASATTNVVLCFLLIPRFGMMGAAWATVIAYGVMAAVGFALSAHVYPIPFEGGRLLRLAAAAAGAYVLSLVAPAALVPAIAVKAATVLAFPALLVSSGFLRPQERRWIRDRLARPA